MAIIRNRFGPISVQETTCVVVHGVLVGYVGDAEGRRRGYLEEYAVEVVCTGALGEVTSAVPLHTDSGSIVPNRKGPLAELSGLRGNGPAIRSRQRATGHDRQCDLIRPSGKDTESPLRRVLPPRCPFRLESLCADAFFTSIVTGDHTWGSHSRGQEVIHAVPKFQKIHGEIMGFVFWSQRGGGKLLRGENFEAYFAPSISVLCGSETLKAEEISSGNSHSILGKMLRAASDDSSAASSEKSVTLRAGVLRV
ncbi:hypothetical protein AAG570_002604 [Ranatra chinensis]|uniref:Uncharacterized protein n=1 Tax=Ranatra chinensis TaxID=642074 RepID=A0ABD0Y8G6_9HEMI